MLLRPRLRQRMRRHVYLSRVMLSRACLRRRWPRFCRQARFQRELDRPWKLGTLAGLRSDQRRSNASTFRRTDPLRSCGRQRAPRPRSSFCPACARTPTPTSSLSRKLLARMAESLRSTAIDPAVPVVPSFTRSPGVLPCNGHASTPHSLRLGQPHPRRVSRSSGIHLVPRLHR